MKPMKKIWILTLSFTLLFSMTACGGSRAEASAVAEVSQTVSEAAESQIPEEKEENQVEEKGLKLTIGDTAVEVNWENNESVDALRALVKDNPLTVPMSMYGGFEQVGSLGTSRRGTIPRPRPRPATWYCIPAIRSSYSTAPIPGPTHGWDISRTKPRRR